MSEVITQHSLQSRVSYLGCLQIQMKTRLRYLTEGFAPKARVDH